MTNLRPGTRDSPDSDWMDMGIKGSASASTGCLRAVREAELLLLRMQVSSTSLKLARREACLRGWPPGSPPAPSCSSTT